jgi:spermidine synthase
VRENFARLDLQIAFCLTLFISVLACWYSFSFYRRKPARSWIRALQDLSANFSFSLDDLGGFSYARLSIASALGLFLELLMIRWISSEVRIFAFLKNYMLVSCFLGFGLGCFLCRRRINLIALIAPLFSLVFLIEFPWQPLRELISALPSYLGVASEVNSMGIPAVPFSGMGLLALSAAVAITVPLFILNAMVFVPLGQLVGGYLEKAPHGIFAYSVNILGSLAGILLFTLLSQFWLPPFAWLTVAGILLTVLVGRKIPLRWASLVGFALCVAFFFFQPHSVGQKFWSPYQYLELSTRIENGEVIAYQLDTNHTWFQQVVNLSPEFVDAHPGFFTDVKSEWDAYNLPYHLYTHPASVLVLGAGMGNDVAAALRNGAGHVVAVEIDPLIQHLGRQYHFERPYSSARVTAVVNDARSYIENSRDKFDLIVYSLLDSHTNISNYSSVRIDNFVYTREALDAARRLLKNDGLLVLKFQAHTPWIAGRLNGLLETVFAQTPLSFHADASKYSSGGQFFVVGSENRLEQALSSADLRDYLQSHHDVQMESARLTTDDWPYFYQHEPGLPLIVIIMSVLLVLLARLLIIQTGATGQAINWHFFFLGAGFLLLEAQIVSRMAMLFGTTWLVNSVVIAGILVLIVAANTLVDFWPGIPVRFAYAGIGACIAISYLLPFETLFFRAFWVKVVVATLVLCSPVAFGSIVFVRSFADCHFSGQALGSNLLGALVGGMLESMSLWTGIRSLLIFALLLYALSYFFLRRGSYRSELHSQSTLQVPSNTLSEDSARPA